MILWIFLLFHPSSLVVFSPSSNIALSEEWNMVNGKVSLRWENTRKASNGEEEWERNRRWANWNKSLIPQIFIVVIPPNEIEFHGFGALCSHCEIKSVVNLFKFYSRVLLLLIRFYNVFSWCRHFSLETVALVFDWSKNIDMETRRKFFSLSSSSCWEKLIMFHGWRFCHRSTIGIPNETTETLSFSPNSPFFSSIVPVSLSSLSFMELTTGRLDSSSKIPQISREWKILPRKARKEKKLLSSPWRWLAVA